MGFYLLNSKLNGGWWLNVPPGTKTGLRQAGSLGLGLLCLPTLMTFTPEKRTLSVARACALPPDDLNRTLIKTWCLAAASFLPGQGSRRYSHWGAITMTTTGAGRSLTGTVLTLLAVIVLCGPGASPTLADTVEPTSTEATTPAVVPEPATLLFAGAAGAVLFRRRREWRAR